MRKINKNSVAFGGCCGEGECGSDRCILHLVTIKLLGLPAPGRVDHAQRAAAINPSSLAHREDKSFLISLYRSKAH